MCQSDGCMASVPVLFCVLLCGLAMSDFESDLASDPGPDPFSSPAAIPASSDDVRWSSRLATLQSPESHSAAPESRNRGGFRVTFSGPP